MSLVSVHAKCSDNLWYKHPLWHGDVLDDGTFPWFVCLDDDDLPELVVQLHQPLPSTPWINILGELRTGSLRVFTRDGSMEFRDAMSCWILINRTPPPPEKYDWVSPKRPEGECVAYEWD